MGVGAVGRFEDGWRGVEGTWEVRKVVGVECLAVVSSSRRIAVVCCMFLPVTVNGL